MIVCPVCKSKLEEIQEGFICSNHQHCDHSLNQNKFKLFCGQPLLISFKHTNTVCKESDYEDEKFRVVNRRNEKLAMIFHRFVYGSSKETKKNINIFENSLKNKKNANVLIVGGGTEGHSIKSFYQQGFEITSVDIYPSDHTDYLCDAHFMPFEDESFDGVIIQAVLEHVLDPKVVAFEIWRVLKKDGLVYAETSFLQHVHEKEYDFTRYTPNGHRHLFKDFESISFGTISGPFQVLAWVIRNIFESIFKSRFIGKFISIPFFILSNLFDRFLKNELTALGSSGVYFLGKKSDIDYLRANKVQDTFKDIDKY